MSVEGVLLTGEKIVLLSASGPASDTTVTAGGSATVDLTISLGPVYRAKPLAIRSVSGLPAGVVIGGIEFPDDNTVRITVVNTGTGDVTVTAGSVTAYVLAKAL